MDIGTTIGERIVYFRQLKGWSQKQLREAAGILQSRMSKIESGDAKPRFDEVELLSLLLEQPLEFFSILRRVVMPGHYAAFVRKQKRRLRQTI